jgi:hypothetical protein
MNDPTRALQALLQVDPGASQFPPNSRYHGCETTRIAGPDGQPIVYLRRRFVPPREEFSIVQEHTVTEGERFDTIAARYLGDPEQSWRLCDANGVMRPQELTDTPGMKVQIALPHGVQGPGDA